jgi:predicted aspartyl protease
MEHPRDLWLTLAVFLLLLFSVNAAAAKSGQGLAYTAAIGLQRATVSFRLYRGYLIVVTGSLGGMKNQRLLIDTGGAPSVVDVRAARKLGLNGIAGSLALLNGKVAAEQSVLSDVEVGPIRAESVLVMVRNLSFLDEALGEHIDAVLGLDVMARSSFRIDYHFRKIVFGPVTPAEIAVPFESGPPFVTVNMRINDLPVRLLVDTGASSLTLFASRIGGAADTSAIPQVKKATSFAGDFTMRGLVVRQASLGGKELAPLQAFLAEDRKDDGRGFDGLLSVAALRFRQVAFDFEDRVLYFTK